MKRLIDAAIWLGIFLCACLLACALAFPAWAHDMPGVSPEMQKWYSQVEITTEAQKRLPWVKCCNHAEVVDSKFIVEPNGNDGWRWNDHGVLKVIPADIIHWDEVAPDGKATLFVYNGQMTCFYPPEGGL